MSFYDYDDTPPECADYVFLDGEREELLEQAKDLCFETVVFKASIGETEIENARDLIVKVGYEQAKAEFLQYEAEFHDITVEQLNLVLSGKLKPEHFGMKPVYGGLSEDKQAA